jgi:hypothetical protein
MTRVGFRYVREWREPTAFGLMSLLFMAQSIIFLVIFGECAATISIGFACGPWAICPCPLLFRFAWHPLEQPCTF